jgi:ribonuclease HIII
MSLKPLVTELTASQIAVLKKELMQMGCSFTNPPYTHFSAKKEGLAVTAYTSGKVTIQGKGAEHFVEFVFEPMVLHELRFTGKTTDLQERIGSDESGKGDVFGPLVVSCCFAKAEQIDYLVKLGVMDSKKISEVKILSFEKQIASQLLHETVLISPAKYNQLYEKILNLNDLLAWAHAQALENLVKRTKAPLAIVDQFAKGSIVKRALMRKGVHIEVEERVRAEEDPVVAAASILARARFVRAMKEMEEKWGVLFPKGASQATKEALYTFCAKHGKEQLPFVAKMHFKTVSHLL